MSFRINSGGFRINSGGFTATSTGAVTLAIGDSYGGGIVAYIYQPGDPGYVSGEQHGLIAGISDVGNFRWGGKSDYTDVTTGATATALGTGLSNTNTIVSIIGGGADNAVAAARNYTAGGFNDWFLPSKDELNKLYLSREIVGNYQNNPTFNGAFNYYWSSSENASDGIRAWLQNFSLTGPNSGFQGDSAPKAQPWYVRAARYF